MTYEHDGLDRFYYRTAYALAGFDALSLFNLFCLIEEQTSINIKDWRDLLNPKHQGRVLVSTNDFLLRSTDKGELETETFRFSLVELVERSVKFAPRLKSGFAKNVLAIQDPGELTKRLTQYASNRKMNLRIGIKHHQGKMSRMLQQDYSLEAVLLSKDNRAGIQILDPYARMSKPPFSKMISVSIQGTAYQLRFGDIKQRLEEVYFDLADPILGVIDRDRVAKFKIPKRTAVIL